MTAPLVVLIDSPTDQDAALADALRVASAAEPHIDVMDLGITRGDGIFETVGIVAGAAHAMDLHLQRFVRSAEILELPRPNTALFAAAVALGIEQMPEVQDGYCKFVLTRGREGGSGPSQPTGYAYFDANPDWSRERQDGISVVLLSRGYQLDVQTEAPWLLQGAKTLSYAVNRAVIREAARRGADDVIFTTIDGYVLEGPTSSLVFRVGDTVITPAPSGGVLEGTAQRDAFRFFADAGLRTETRNVRIDEIAGADAMWLLNSQRLAAPVHTLDGTAVRVDRDVTGRLNAFLRGRRE